MCIEPVPAFPFRGKLYLTEVEALEAAIDEIGRDLKRNYFNDPTRGLVRYSETLASLLSRYNAVQAPTPAAGKGPSTKASGEPKRRKPK